MYTLDFFSWDVQLSLFFRICLAAGLGSVVGYERKNREQDAGSRTHAIVCLGAALFMLISKYGFADVSELGGYDVARIAAQVVSGIGFLGAGIIFVRHNMVSGLTTAAGMWATAGVGMAAGAGLYILAVAVTFLILVIQSLNMDMSNHPAEKSSDRIYIVTSAENGKELTQELIETFEDNHILYGNIKIGRKGKKMSLRVDLIYPTGFPKRDFVLNMMQDERMLEFKG